MVIATPINRVYVKRLIFIFVLYTVSDYADSCLAMKPIKDIIQSARVAAFSIPDEMRQSFPIPGSREKRQLVFIYAMGRTKPREGTTLHPPSHLIIVSADDAAVTESREITPEDLGSPPVSAVAIHALPPGATLDQREKQREQLEKIYDILLPVYFFQAQPSPELPQICQEFLDLFNTISEKPLAPYYGAVGVDFFGWIRQNAKNAPANTGKICSMEEVSKMAWIAIEDRVMYEGNRQTLPIPILKDKKLFLIFIYYGSVNRPLVSSVLSHPKWIQSVEYPTGRPIELRQTTPEEFGLKEWRDPIGELPMPAGMSFSDFIEGKKELLTLLDSLLPAFREWNNRTDADRQNVKRYQELFDKISEPPLKPYYEAVGYNWFHWLKQ